MPRLRTLILIGVLALFLFQVGGLVLIKAGIAKDLLNVVLLRGAKPAIEIKAEQLWKIGFFPITNTLLTSWIVVLFLIGLAYLATRRMELVPSGLQNAVEAVVEALFGLVVGTAGEKEGRRFFPVIATIFLFIVVANWFALLPIFNAIGKVETLGPGKTEFRAESVVIKGSGLSLILPGAKQLKVEVDESPCTGLAGDAKPACLTSQREKAIEQARAKKGLGDNQKTGVIAPYLRSMNTDLMSTASFAIVSAIFVEYWGISALGFFSYAGKFFNVRRLMKGELLMGGIDLAVGGLEFIAELARLISFTFRLFGNMLAGEVLLLVMTFLIPLLLALPFYGLELFVGAIQAFVFAMLTLVFGTLAIAGHGDHEAEGHAQRTEVATVH